MPDRRPTRSVRRSASKTAARAAALALGLATALTACGEDTSATAACGIPVPNRLMDPITDGPLSYEGYDLTKVTPEIPDSFCNFENADGEILGSTGVTDPPTLGEFGYLKFAEAWEDFPKTRGCREIHSGTHTGKGFYCPHGAQLRILRSHRLIVISVSSDAPGTHPNAVGMLALAEYVDQELGPSPLDKEMQSDKARTDM